MNRYQAEFLLKGIYLGFLFFIALQAPSWKEVGLAALCSALATLFAVALAGIRQLRRGYRSRGQRLTYLLFCLLENPGLIYAGVIGGMALGAFLVRQTGEESTRLLFGCVGGGALLGLVMWLLRFVAKARLRYWAGLALVAALLGGGVALLYYQPQLLSEPQRIMLGYILLLGLPGFYLLNFVGVTEETEGETAAWCAALGLGLWLVGLGYNQVVQILGVGLAIILYLIYCQKILPGLRIWKHVLRGISFAGAKNYRVALQLLGRANQLDPQNEMAKKELWKVHTQLDFDEVAKDPDTLAVVNFDLCLNRASSLLMNPPTEEQLAEAKRLIDLVASQRPLMLPKCDYWRAVGFLHERQFGEAAQALLRVLATDELEPSNPHRAQVLLPAWGLALTHPEMHRQVTIPLFIQPGRRLQAIAAVEKQLQNHAEDEEAKELKRRLYGEVMERDYVARFADKPCPFFDHPLVQGLGKELLADPARWERGAEYLRLAARGLPQLGPALFVDIAQAAEKAGDTEAAWANYEMAKQAGLAFGPSHLEEKDRDLFYQVVKMLAEAHRDSGRWQEAIDNFKLFLDSGKAGKETYRTLADLHEKKAELWPALFYTEHALTYDSTDTELLGRKDRYYYSITAEEVGQRKEQVYKWFDISYCLNKARLIVTQHSTNLEMIDWAGHLLGLAQVLQPDNLILKFLRGRICRLRGEIPEAIALFEEIRGQRPVKFASSEEEESWYGACRTLGDLYLNEQPVKAFECFREYQKFPKSGADTLYKLGVACEHLGDRARAAKYYEQVTAYDHPLTPDAREALQRLKSAS